MPAALVADATAGVDDQRFRAMGSDGQLIVVEGGAGLLEHARWRIAELEQRWSRFIPESDVSRMNQAAGDWVAVSPDTLALVEQARLAWLFSGGAFDPTVLGDVIRAGYDRSFADVAAAPHAGRSALQPGCDGIEVQDGRVRLPAGTGFDPGGIGKGLAADMVATWVMNEGAAGVCVNLGGDLRVAGTAPGGGAWRIAVEHLVAPGSSDERMITELIVGDGAVATSTTQRRRWEIDGEVRHHLIDPQTGLPSTTDLTLATVVAGEAWAAEVLAKAVLLKGSSHPFDILGGTGAEGLAVDAAGSVVTTPGLSRYLVT